MTDTIVPTSDPPIPTKAEKIAALKAQYPQGRVISFKGDPLIMVVRRPTDAEVLTIYDKSRMASIVKPGDNAYNFDNGTAEILSLVEYPDRAAVEKLANQRPSIAHTILTEVQKLCKISLARIPLDEVDSQKAGGQLVGFLVDGKVKVLLSMITRPTYERLDFQRLKSEHKILLPSWTAAVAKKNILEPAENDADQLWDAYPFLSNVLGVILFGETSLEVEAEEGE